MGDGNPRIDASINGLAEKRAAIFKGDYDFVAHGL
jgi:hypothetical protein